MHRAALLIMLTACATPEPRTWWNCACESAHIENAVLHTSIEAEEVCANGSEAEAVTTEDADACWAEVSRVYTGEAHCACRCDDSGDKCRG